MKTATKFAQSSLFPIGEVVIPQPPAITATTVLFPSTTGLRSISRDSLVHLDDDVYSGFYYGGVDTPSTVALGKAVASIEGGSFCTLAPSGQSIIAATLMALLKPGDHVLITDAITFTTRWYCNWQLARAGVEITYYDPKLGADIERLFQKNTRVIFMESPGSMTFDVEDVPAICRAAASRGILTVLDNSWAGSLCFSPFRHGVDISLVSLTKYHVGNAGVSMGAAVTNSRHLCGMIKNEAALMGLNVGADASSRTSIALGTLHLRMKHQEASTQAVIAGLQGHPMIRRILNPSLPDHPGHALWQRDYEGSNSLFSIAFKDLDRAKVYSVADRFKVVRIGHGWGGSISLVTLFEANEWRTVSKAPVDGTCMRIHVGLEDKDDILADILQALDGAGSP